MAGNGQKSRQQEKAIVGLLHEPTIAQAAEYAGVGESTLYRWLRADPAFQAAYRDARRESVRQASTLLQKACALAVKTLIDVMRDANCTAPSRVTAARSVLELAYKTVEIEDLDTRLRVLEDRSDGAK